MKKVPTRPSHGFSLLELLVAMVLLVILGVVIAQITSSISRATRFSNQGVDAAAQARIAFDRIGMDLASSVLRPDVDFVASSTNSPADNLLAFIASIPSADPAGSSSFQNRRVSFIAYKIGPSADNNDRQCLLRAANAVSWDDVGFMGLQSSNSPVPLVGGGSPLSLASVDFDVLAPAVIHAVIGFQLFPDNQPVTLQDSTPVARAQGQIVYSPPMTAPPNPRIDTSRIAALVVGLVVIDPERLRNLDATTISTLAGKFAGLPDPDQLPVAKWMQTTSNLTDLPSSVPLPVQQSVRLYQRFFPIVHPDRQLP